MYFEKCECSRYIHRGSRSGGRMVRDVVSYGGVVSDRFYVGCRRVPGRIFRRKKPPPFSFAELVKLRLQYGEERSSFDREGEKFNIPKWIFI